MNEPLERFTTEYIDSEDRLRLSGETGAHSLVVIWLTQRLLQRLVPILLQWLEQKQGNVALHAEILQGWAQQFARAAVTIQQPVKVGDGGSSWLARSVHVSPSSAAVVLAFGGPHGERAELAFAVEPLRQWLNFVYDAHVAAGWSLAIWPEWVVEAAVPQQSAPARLH